MKKSLVWIIIVIILVAGYFVRQQYSNMPSLDATTEEVVDAMTGDDMIQEDMSETTTSGEVAQEVIQPTDGGETGVDPAVMEQLEAEATVDAWSEELTDEDIKLIEDILQQITDSVQE